MSLGKIVVGSEDWCALPQLNIPAIKARVDSGAKTLNLKVAGVDIIRGKNSPLLLEVNSSLGLEGIEGVSNKDIAGLMIDAIEKDLKFSKTEL